jgi:hypothetical protein
VLCDGAMDAMDATLSMVDCKEDNTEICAREPASHFDPRRTRWRVSGPLDKKSTKIDS